MTDPRHRAKRILRWVALVLAITHLTWFIANLVMAYPCCRPSIRIPETNRSRYANVVILIDPTYSMRENDFERAKEIAKDRIIPSLGLADMLTICSIGPVFRTENCIQAVKAPEAAATQDETPPEEILRIVEEHRKASKNGVGKQRFYELLRKVHPRLKEVGQARNRSRAFVDAMRRSTMPGSNFCGALNVTERVFGSALRNKTAMDKELFVIGDLVHESEQKCSDAPRESSWFSGVKVSLIYPLDSKRDWEQILSFWGRYFRGAAPAKVPFLTALAGNGYLLPPNTLSHVRTDVPTYVQCLRGPVQFQLKVLCGSLLAYALLAMFLLRVSRPAPA